GADGAVPADLGGFGRAGAPPDAQVTDRRVADRVLVGVHELGKRRAADVLADRLGLAGVDRNAPVAGRLRRDFDFVALGHAVLGDREAERRVRDRLRVQVERIVTPRLEEARIDRVDPRIERVDMAVHQRIGISLRLADAWRVAERTGARVRVRVAGRTVGERVSKQLVLEAAGPHRGEGDLVADVVGAGERGARAVGDGRLVLVHAEAPAAVLGLNANALVDRLAGRRRD